MEEEYIDVRNTKEQFERSVARYKADPAVSARNKEIVLSFVRDAALGKTVIGKAKKKIGPARLLGYISQLYPLILFVNKDLDHVKQDDMEAFIEALEGDQIRSRKPQLNGARVCRDGSRLSVRYKIDIKITIKKFYKWLWGNNRTYPEIVEWIDTYAAPKEIPALTQDEVERIIDRCSTPLQRAIIQVLFDGGMRIGELLNVRLRHVRLRAYDPADPTKQCFCVRVPFSKTMPRTVALPMKASSKWLRIWLECHPARPMMRSDGTIEATDMEMQLFPMSDNAVRLLVRRAGRRALGKRVYPHLMRHTSATYWSNKLPYFKFCKRFGWTMTSKMPQRYIDREGVDELEVAAIHDRTESDRLLRDNRRLQEALALATSTTGENVDAIDQRALGRDDRGFGSMRFY